MSDAATTLAEIARRHKLSRKATEEITALLATLRPRAAGKPPVACGCGCGRDTQSRFAPGHDARLKGALIAAFRTPGTKVATPLCPGITDPVKIAAALGWSAFLRPKATAKVAAPPAKPAKQAKPAAKPAKTPARKSPEERAREAAEAEERRAIAAAERKAQAGALVGDSAQPTEDQPAAS